MVALALGLVLTGCKEVESSSAKAYVPATLQEVGSAGLQQVTFTPAAAKRVALETTTAVRSGRHTVVDYAALIYDGKGVTWVYTVGKPLTYLRAKVVVDRIEGNRVYLSSGLPAGTTVVTVGATEVYGAELGISGGH